jgi:hypothetical protein
MKQPQRGALFAIALLVFGCEGSEVAIFATSAAGSAGSSGESGSSTSAGSAGFLGSSGGAGGNTFSVPDGGLEAGPPPCTATSDCPGPGWLCTKDGCAAIDGVCVPVPVFCPADALPVCGCDDHVAYWNDCVRQQAGERASSSGECGEGARVCDSSVDCPADATCSHLLPPASSCSQPGSGNCWVTPFGCPEAEGSGGNTAEDTRRWMPCGPPGGGGPPPCISTCQAIQAGRAYQPMPAGAQCF